MNSDLENVWRTFAANFENLTVYPKAIKLNADGSMEFILGGYPFLTIVERSTDCYVSYEDWHGKEPELKSHPCVEKHVLGALEVTAPSVLKDVSFNLEKIQKMGII